MKIERLTKAAVKARRAEAHLIYFIEAPEQGLIKIGYALDPRGRYLNILTGSAVPLALLGCIKGSWDREAEIHASLGAHHSHGEWFRRCPEIDRLMENMDTSWAMPVALATRREPLNPAALLRARGLHNHPGMDKDAAA
jgi:hypothetical protein